MCALLPVSVHVVTFECKSQIAGDWRNLACKLFMCRLDNGMGNAPDQWTIKIKLGLNNAYYLNKSSASQKDRKQMQFRVIP